MKFSSLLPAITSTPATPPGNFVQLPHPYIGLCHFSRLQTIHSGIVIVPPPVIILRFLYSLSQLSLAILLLGYLMISAFKTTRPANFQIPRFRLFHSIDDLTTYSRYQANRFALKLQTPAIGVDSILKNISTFFQIQKHGHETDRKIIMQTGQ